MKIVYEACNVSQGGWKEISKEIYDKAVRDYKKLKIDLKDAPIRTRIIK